MTSNGDYTPPLQLKGISSQGAHEILLTAAQTRMVYIMLGLITDGDRTHTQKYDATHFWFHGRGYGKTTVVFTAARYAEAAHHFWQGHEDEFNAAVKGIDREFLDWYVEANHI